MKEVTRDMIKNFQLKKAGYDFMGYTFKNPTELSFHHLIVAHRDCHAIGLGEGYFTWNGAILKQDTSHDYLHLIEHKDPEIFWLITSEMIDENVKGRLDIDNLKQIRDLLLCFEKEHRDDEDKKGKRLIKREFITTRIPL